MAVFFRYRFKALIRQKPLVFWAFLFPIILVTFFSLAFSNLNGGDGLKPFSVAIVGTEESNVVSVMRQIEVKGERLFKLKFVNEAKARKLLDNSEVEGVITISDAIGASRLQGALSANSKSGDDPFPRQTMGLESITLGVNSDELNQIILKEFLDNYKQKTVMIANAIKENPDLMMSGTIEKFDFAYDNIEHMPVSEKSNDAMLISFYSAIAMTCLYGAFISAQSMDTLQASQSAAGQRLSVSPYRKSKMLVIDVIICFLLILLCVLFVMAYMRFVLHIEFSGMVGGMILVSAAGAIVATAFGYFISILLKRKTNAKVSIIVSITMLWSALAGMMAPPIKYYIEKHVPFINWINPVALITDSYTAMYYYGNLERVYSNILVLGILFVFLMGFSVMKLRRQQYESL